MNGQVRDQNQSMSVQSVRVRTGIRKKRRKATLTQQEAISAFNYCRETGVLTWSEDRPRSGMVAGNLTSRGYWQVHINGTRYKNHRIVWLIHHGYFPENELDHLDSCKTNNRIENLREVSRACNMANTKTLWRTSTTGVRGVGSRNCKGKYVSKIKVGGVAYFLGWFNDFIEAVAHRLAAEQCLGYTESTGMSSAEIFLRKYLDDKNILCQ